MVSNRRFSLFVTATLLGASLLGFVIFLSDRSSSVAAAGESNGESSALSQPNIILIMADTLRSDHMSAYGYGRATTPNLDARIAAQGAMFLNATTTSPWTCPANAAIMTGRMPSDVGTTWETLGVSIPPGEKTLAELMHDAGYYTAGFPSAYCVKGSIGFAQGFDHYDDALTDRPSSNKARATEINTMVFDWIDNTWTPVVSGTKPLFLFVYYFDPHTWYDPPAPYDVLFTGSYTGTLTPAQFGDGKPAKTGTLTLTPADLQYLLALYDGEIRYWDFHLDALLDRLETEHLLDNALVIVTTDHGEMFGEHGEWAHAGSLYEEVLRIPFFIRYTGVITAGLQITSLVQNMDLMPTILDYAGIPIPTNLRAVSLRPLINGQPPMPSRSVHSEVDGILDPNHMFYWTTPRDDLRTVRQNDWKLIHHVANAGQDELYALQPGSPYEIVNQVPQQPARTSQMRSDVMNWFSLYRQFLPVARR